MISKNWWREAKVRWATKSHTWFKKMKPALLVIIFTGAAGAVEIKLLRADGEDVPDFLFHFCLVMSSIATGIGIAAKLTVHDSENPNPPAQ